MCIMHACERGSNSRATSVCLSLNSSQLLAPFTVKSSGHVGDPTGYAYFKNEHDWLRNKKLSLMATYGSIAKTLFFT